MQVQLEQQPRPGVFSRFFRGVSRWLAAIRRWGLNLLTLLFLIFLVTLLVRGCSNTESVVKIKDKTALVLNLKWQ